jgi:hypothetical protein
MGASLVMRTGNLRSEPHIEMVYAAQVLNGASFAMIAVTNLPEVMDCVE